MNTDGIRIAVLVVDDHALLRQGIAAAFEGEPDLLLAGEATNGWEAVAKYRALQPDVTLMDLQMPRMNGIEAIAAIRREYPEARIVVLTMFDGDVQALRAMKAGAAGYILKSTARKDLLQTVRSVHGGKCSILAPVAMKLAEHVGDEMLTDRELDVLRCVSQGNGNKEVAAQLNIAEDTVKSHMRNVLSKLNAKDRTHAVVIAVQRGIF